MAVFKGNLEVASPLSKGAGDIVLLRRPLELLLQPHAPAVKVKSLFVGTLLAELYIFGSNSFVVCSLFFLLAVPIALSLQLLHIVLSFGRPFGGLVGFRLPLFAGGGITLLTLILVLLLSFRGVDPTEGVVYLDQEAAVCGASTWTLGGTFVVPSFVKGTSLGLSLDVTRLVGSTILQHQTLSAISDVQQALLDFWTPKWQAIDNIPMELWDRLSGFITAFMPKLHNSLPAITIEQWKKGLRRFKSYAARGTDGFSHLDLINMPDNLMESLLDLFNGIEEDRLNWPLQFLHGMINSLPKTSEPNGPSDFRPVVILPVAYRAWSSIRSRQMIRFLLPHVSDGAYGFLPGKEPMQIWASLQGLIECASQGSVGLSGLSTDLRKAFNCIARPPTFALATHLGAPVRLVHAWSTYLQEFSRSFRISTFVGGDAHSTVGLPEGCGLSVYAMLNVCWAWHKYMECFHPSVQATSYVDNLGLRALEPELVASAFFGIITFFQFFHLEVDPGKTFTWGLSVQDRRTLSSLGFTCVSAASELGGAITYGTMIRNSQLKARVPALSSSLSYQGSSSWWGGG